MSRRPTLGSNKSARTALAIIPPPALWPAIQPLRRAFDPSHPRWPPHMNLLFPFVPLSTNNNGIASDADHAHLPSVLEQIRTALVQSCHPTSIHIELAQASTFFQRKVAIVHAQPVSASSSLLPMHAALMRAFPQCTDTADHAGGYHPHLTLAKVPWNADRPRQTQGNLDTVLAAAAKAVQEYPHSGVLEWDAQGVYLLERLDNDPFTFVGHVGFDGSTDGDPYGLVGTTYSPDADLYAPLPTPAASQAVQIAEPKYKCSDVCSRPNTADAIQLATRPWLQYPYVDSANALASDVYDQAWVVLPTYQYNEDQQVWAKVSIDQLNQHHSSQHKGTDSLSIITYNVLNSLSPNAHARHTRLLAQLERAAAAHSVSVIALQELTPTFLTLLLDQKWVKSSWSVSHTPDFASPIFPAMGAQGFLVHTSLGAFAHMHMRLTGKKAHCSAYIPQVGAWIANVHLTSNHTTNRDPKDKRVAQMDPVGQLLERHAGAARGGLAMVVGDFNSDDHEEDGMLIGRFGLVDGASELGCRLDTFDPTQNVLALAVATNKEAPHAYDRVVYRGQDNSGGWVIKEMTMIGDRVEDEQDLTGVDDEEELSRRGWPASDHYGVVARFVSTSSTSATHHPTSGSELDSLISNHTIHSRLAALHNYESQSQHALRTRALDLLTHHLNHLDRMPPLAIPHLLPVGSVRLGLHTPESDTDLLCLVITSPSLFADAIERTPCPTDLRLMRVIRDSSVPTAQFMAFDKVHMDVQYVAPSTAFLTRAGELLANPVVTADREWPNEKKSVTSALLSVRDAATAAAHLTPAGQLAFRVLRLWAIDQGLYAGRVGYLSGAALVVLVMRVLHVHPMAAHSAAAIVKHFFNDYARFPFASVAVTVGGAPTAPVRGAMVVESLNRPRVNITRHASVATRGVLVTRLREMQSQSEDPAAVILGLDTKPGHRRSQVVKHGWQRFLGEYDMFIDVGMGRSASEAQDPEGIRVWRLAVGTVRWNQVLARVDRIIEAHEAAAAKASNPSLLCNEDLLDAESQPPPSRAQEVPPITVHVWPVAWQTKDIACLSDVAMNKLYDVDAHYLIGVRGVESGSMLMHRILVEIETAVRPPSVEDIKGATVSSVAAPWWAYVTCATQAEVAALGLVPVDREWADPGPTETLDEPPMVPDDAAPTLPSELDLPPSSPAHPQKASATKQPKSKSKSKSSRSSDSRPASKGKLRPSQDVMHRLLWDPDTYDAADFVVGYIDRFLGIKERPLLAFRSDDEADPDWVPLHRIVHFRRVSDGVKVWDREKKVDLVFGNK